MYKLTDYDYNLPEELIAQHPVARRDHSRLMVLHKQDGRLEHKLFSDIIDYLLPGDILVINETKVLPARIFGRRKNTGAKIEILLLKQLTDERWEVLVKPGKRARVGESIVFYEQDGQKIIMEASIIANTDHGGRILEFSYRGNFLEILNHIGTMPLPPYIKEKLTDQTRYQTVYANITGSAAAPTAGLHFTTELLDTVQQKGIKLAKVLLHVGLGTFRPVEAEDIRAHKMHQEYYQVSPETAKLINDTRRNGGRIIAVGTTSVRTLETVADTQGIVRAGSGYTDIFIYPGYKFKCVDGLITNFHLPKSSLLMLVSAFVGREQTLQAYQEAVKEKYRFFSFGDAMLII